MSVVMEKRFDATSIWEQFGITQHLGGLNATKRLLDSVRADKVKNLLDIGCGTGYTACLVSKSKSIEVVGIDLRAGLLGSASDRTSGSGPGGTTSLIECDAQRLPIVSESFEAAISESVLVFCDAGKVLSEAYRVLKRGAIFGINEMTLLKPPPKDLFSWFWEMLRIWPRYQQDWTILFEQAGFEEVTSKIYSFTMREDFFSHLKVDGFRYFSTLVKSFADATVSNFVTKEMLVAGIRFAPYIGYGIYSGRKI